MRTGHGLGLAPVEAPNLGAGDETPLEAGMVISIEPGVCIPGAGGALWADNYVVTREGVERLDRLPGRGDIGCETPIRVRNAPRARPR